MCCTRYTPCVTQITHRVLHRLHTVCYTDYTPCVTQITHRVLHRLHTVCYTDYTPCATQITHRVLHRLHTVCYTDCTPCVTQITHRVLHRLHRVCYTDYTRWNRLYITSRLYTFCMTCLPPNIFIEHLESLDFSFPRSLLTTHIVLNFSPAVTTDSSIVQ